MDFQDNLNREFEKGTSSSEYAILLAGIVGVSLAILTSISSATKSLYDKTIEALNDPKNQPFQQAYLQNQDQPEDPEKEEDEQDDPKKGDDVPDQLAQPSQQTNSQSSDEIIDTGLSYFGLAAGVLGLCEVLYILLAK